MDTPFSKTFARLRKEAGFSTAYQFFHKNGGQQVFQCTFPNYLRIEKGSHLPKPKRLPLLITLLRLPMDSRDLRALIESYLETWLGSRDLTDWFLQSFTTHDPAAAPPDPAHAALAKLTRHEARPISAAQYEALMSSAGAYWAFRVLSTSKDAYEIHELAALTGLRSAELRIGLSALRREILVERLRDGRWRSPLAGDFLLFPDSRLISAKTMEKVFRYNEAMVARKGALVDVRYCGLRADARAMEGFLPHFREAIRSVNAYAQSEKSEHSALFFVEGRVQRLLDF